jgi:hypothetical protein
MILGNRIFAKRHVTFGADEIWILLAAIDFKIQRATFVDGVGNVTTVGAAT